MCNYRIEYTNPNGYTNKNRNRYSYKNPNPLQYTYWDTLYNKIDHEYRYTNTFSNSSSEYSICTLIRFKYSENTLSLWICLFL
jgi:hypothetical protein